MSLFTKDPEYTIPLARAQRKGEAGRERSKKDVCSQVARANKINPTWLGRRPAERCQPIHQQGHQPQISECGAGTSVGGQKKWHGPMTRYVAAAAAGGLSPGNLSAAPGRAESKQRFPTNPQALRAPPSPPHPPPTASRFGFLPSTELRPPLGLALSLDSHLICSMQRNTCIDREPWPRTRCLTGAIDRPPPTASTYTLVCSAKTAHFH